MVKKIILISLFILLLGICSVNALQYEPVNVSGKVGEYIQGQIAVFYDNTTEHRFDIYNITLEDMTGFEFFQIDKLSFNETGYINYTYLTSTPQNEVQTGVLWYYYYTNTTQQPTQHVILINNNRIEQTNITIYKNDSISWTNDGQNNLTLTNLDDLSDSHAIPVLDEYIRTFTEIGNFNYFEETSNNIGYVNIISNIYETATHTPNYDKNIQFNISTRYRDADFTVDLLPTSFSMEHNEVKSGLIQITANDTLHNVKLTGDWFGFSDNDFNMDGDKIFSFNITTDITTSDQTNRSYQKTIKIETDNAGTVEKNISIFVEYATLDELQEQLGDVVLIPMTPEQTFAYCNKPEVNWTGICKRWIHNTTVEKLVPRVLYPEINETEAKESLDASSRAEEGVNRVSNKVEDLARDQRDLMIKIDDMVEKLDSFDTKYSDKIDAIELDVNKKRRDSGTFMFLILMFGFFALIGGGVYAIIYFRKKRKPKVDLTFG